MSAEKLYRIIFVHEDELFEIYARDVQNSELFGFVDVEQWVFGERSQVLIDPAEERLENLFAGVTRSMIPMQAILRIDEVEKRGLAKISPVRMATVSHMPGRPDRGPSGR